MRKFKFVIDTGYYGAGYEDIFEFDDDVTEKELRKELDEFVYDMIDSYWEEIGDDEE